MTQSMVSWSAHCLRHEEETGLDAIIQSAARENTGRETLVRFTRLPGCKRSGQENIKSKRDFMLKLH